MKIKQLKSLYDILLVIFIILMSACKSESSYTIDYFIINNSNHELKILKYSIQNDTVLLAVDADYLFTYYANEPAVNEPFYDVKDSIVLLFDDNKKIVYTPFEYVVASHSKNIYNRIFYEMTEIDTGKDRYYHFVYKYYITPEDYGLAE